MLAAAEDRSGGILKLNRQGERTLASPGWALAALAASSPALALALLRACPACSLVEPSFSDNAGASRFDLWNFGGFVGHRARAMAMRRTMWFARDTARAVAKGPTAWNTT